jgi:tRNA A37 threonylcarbamoyladenosine dehydratase
MCKLHLIDDFVAPQNWQDLVKEITLHAPISAVIDACDQVLAKTTMAAWALREQTMTFAVVGAAGGKQQAELVQVEDLANVTHDPLLAKLRYNLRRQHGAGRDSRIGIVSVFSKEAVLQPASDPSKVLEASDGSLNCHGFGSSVAVTATFGMCAAGFVVKSLAKLPKSTL